MKNTLEIQEKITQFILKTSYASPDQVNSNTLIFQQGIMDSMGFISIIDFLEDSFSISVADHDLIEANFESIEAITAFVTRKVPVDANQIA